MSKCHLCGIELAPYDAGHANKVTIEYGSFIRMRNGTCCSDCISRCQSAFDSVIEDCHQIRNIRHMVNRAADPRQIDFAKVKEEKPFLLNERL